MRTHLGLGLAMVLTAACSNSVFTSTDDAGNTGDGGNVDPINGGDAGGKVDAVAPPGCDQSKLPTDDLCVVNDAEGVFVSSSTGAATGDGSRAKPLASLNAAIALANKYSMRVYACAETYAESVAFADGTNVFGYFDCKNGWTANAQSHAKIQSPTSPAATATNITHATRVEAVDIFAPDFTSKSQSSIALIASGSPALLIKGSTIHAGTGGKGDDGADGVPLSNSGNQNGAAGNAFGGFYGLEFLAAMHGYLNEAGGTNDCGGHVGGPGGSGGAGGVFVGGMFGQSAIWSNDTTYPVQAGNPTTPTSQTAQGGAVGLGGSNGFPGIDGTNGANGSAFGTLNTGVYTSATGGAATDGAPGQGGGGSGGYELTFSAVNPTNYQNQYGWGSSGAGGGAGGCPGLAGQPGMGGGASLAVVAISSPMTLETVVVEASAGGAAGAAGKPSAPTMGGTGGAPVAYTVGGGTGGHGGLGGVSGNGGGGPSVGIVAVQGTQPTLSASTIKQGAGGVGVPQRTTSNGQIIPASPDGTSATIYAYGA